MGKRSVRTTRLDRVPAGVSVEAREGGAAIDRPHWIERQVQHRLLSHPQLHFSSLVIRRIRNGVCLDGILEADDEAPDVTCLAQEVSGVDEVRNRLVVRYLQKPPAKG